MSAFWRVLSFFEQWAAEVFHRPMLLFTLIVAPFLVLLVFGTGIELGGPKPRTVIDRDADVVVLVDPPERLAQGGAQLRVHRVHRVRAVEGDRSGRRCSCRTG